MVDDFYNPEKPNQDCHSCEGAEPLDEAVKEMGITKDELAGRIEAKLSEGPELPADDGYCHPPTLRNVLYRFPELWTDPSSNQLSASRFVTFWIGMWICFIAVHETLYGRAGAITTMLTAAFATAAGIYFGSTVKDFRWRKRNDE